MARPAKETERPARRRRASRRDQTEGVLRATDSAQDAAEGAAGNAQEAGGTAAGAAQGAAAAGDWPSRDGTGGRPRSRRAPWRPRATWPPPRWTRRRTPWPTATEAVRRGSSARYSSPPERLPAKCSSGRLGQQHGRLPRCLPHAAPEIAREQLGKRGGSNAAGRAAVEYGRAKLQGAGGTKALTAAAVGAAKESAGGLRTEVTDALSGEKGEDAEGGTSRLPVEVSVDIGAPRQVVWDEWTQFENSPESLHRIQWTEDGGLKVSAKVWGSTKEEEVEITDQVAEERLAWRGRRYPLSGRRDLPLAGREPDPATGDPRVRAAGIARAAWRRGSPDRPRRRSRRQADQG